MKISAQEAINLLKDLDPNSKILFWFRTKEDMNCSDSSWEKLVDDSQGLEETIDEYVNGWIEEAED